VEPEVDARAVDTLFRLLDAFLDQRQTHNGMRKIYDDYRAWAEADDRRRQELLRRYAQEADLQRDPSTALRTARLSLSRADRDRGQQPPRDAELPLLDSAALRGAIKPSALGNLAVDFCCATHSTSPDTPATVIQASGGEAGNDHQTDKYPEAHLATFLSLTESLGRLAMAWYDGPRTEGLP
jgi:hypothetical protein